MSSLHHILYRVSVCVYWRMTAFCEQSTDWTNFKKANKLPKVKKVDIELACRPWCNAVAYPFGANCQAKMTTQWLHGWTLTCSDDCSNKTDEWNVMHLLPISSFHFSSHSYCSERLFLVTWGGVAPRSESSNQIAERVIICPWCKRSYFKPNWKNLTRSSIVLSFPKELRGLIKLL